MDFDRSCGNATISVNGVDFTPHSTNVVVAVTPRVAESSSLADCGVKKIPTFTDIEIRHTSWYDGEAAGDVVPEIQAAIGATTTPTVIVTLTDTEVGGGTKTYTITSAHPPTLSVQTPVDDFMIVEATWKSFDGAFTLT